jgi:transposase-like protein
MLNFFTGKSNHGYINNLIESDFDLMQWLH